MRFAQHHVYPCAHQVGQVDLVDQQQVRVRLRRATLARNLFTAGDVDHIHRVVHQLRTEGGGEVVTPGFNQQQVQVWEDVLQVFDGVDVDRDVVAHGGVRARASFDAHD